MRAGRGSPLLLIHGLVGGSANWRGNIPALAEHRTVYALDLLGMGQSDRVPGLAAGLRETAQRVLATMDALAIDVADVSAASHGGSVAMMLAAIAPERVRSLVLFAPANPYSRATDWMLRAYASTLGGWAARMAPQLPAWIQRIALRRMFGDPKRIPEGSLEPYRQTLRVPGTIPHVLATVRDWVSEMEKLRGVLPTLARTPTLLVWGDRDRVVSLESGQRLERELGADLVVLRGAGHLVFEELPQQVNQLMIQWLKRR